MQQYFNMLLKDAFSALLSSAHFTCDNPIYTVQACTPALLDVHPCTVSTPKVPAYRVWVGERQANQSLTFNTLAEAVYEGDVPSIADQLLSKANVEYLVLKAVPTYKRGNFSVAIVPVTEGALQDITQRLERSLKKLIDASSSLTLRMQLEAAKEQLLSKLESGALSDMGGGTFALEGTLTHGTGNWPA